LTKSWTSFELNLLQLYSLSCKTPTKWNTTKKSLCNSFQTTPVLISPRAYGARKRGSIPTLVQDSVQ
jgi:hypothetical protein